MCSVSSQAAQKSKLNRDATAKALLDKLNEVISDLQNGKQVSKSTLRQITTALSKYGIPINTSPRNAEGLLQFLINAGKELQNIIKSAGNKGHPFKPGPKQGKSNKTRKDALIREIKRLISDISQGKTSGTDKATLRQIFNALSKYRITFNPPPRNADELLTALVNAVKALENMD